MNEKFIGSDFDDFLEEEGILEAVNTAAIKQILAIQIEKEMKEQNISKTLMAKKLNTSRSQLDRLLDPLNTSVTLATLINAAKVLNKKLEIRLT